MKRKIHSIPIHELETLASSWAGWAKARMIEHAECPDARSKENQFTASGLLSASDDLRALIREITVG